MSPGAVSQEVGLGLRGGDGVAGGQGGHQQQGEGGNLGDWRSAQSRWCFSLNRPSGLIQSLSHNVRMLSVCEIAENLLPGGQETSGRRLYC